MSLRSVVKRSTGQDVYLCHACNDCDIDARDEMDIPLSSLVQLILMNDEEADPVVRFRSGVRARRLQARPRLIRGHNRPSKRNDSKER
jgi:hypothetical protein